MENPLPTLPWLRLLGAQDIQTLTSAETSKLLGSIIANRAALIVLLSARNSRDRSDTWLDEVPKSQKKQLQGQGGSKFTMADLFVQKGGLGWRTRQWSCRVKRQKPHFRDEKNGHKGKEGSPHPSQKGKSTEGRR